MIRPFKLFLPPLLLALAMPLAAQQNQLSNADFALGLAGWTQVGFADTPRIDTFDVTGRGASQAFGCNPGNNQPPFLSLEQTVFLVPGIGLEFFANIAMDAPGFNNDGGQIEAHIGNELIARHDFGAVQQGGVVRVAMSGRIVPQGAGNQTFRLTFSRGFAGLLGRTPRHYVDDLSLRLCFGPSFTIDGERRPGNAVTFRATGDANASFAIFVAGARLPSGIQVPQFLGEWWLDPISMVLLWNGTLSSMGQASQPIFLPSDPGMAGVPLWFQGAQSNAVVISFGVPHDLGLH